MAISTEVKEYKSYFALREHYVNTKVHFNEVTHTYTIEGQVYESATSLNRFNSILFSQDKNLETQHLEFWEKKQKRINLKKAIARGINFHKWIEAYILNKPLPVFENASLTKKVNYLKSSESFNRFLAAHEVVFTEKILASSKLKIAGAVDVLFFNKIEKSFLLLDWKGSTLKPEAKKNDGLEADLMYRHQLFVYSWLISQNFVLKAPLRSAIFFLNNGKDYSFFWGAGKKNISDE